MSDNSTIAEMPSTSDNGIAAAASSTSIRSEAGDWVCFENFTANNDGATAANTTTTTDAVAATEKFNILQEMDANTTSNNNNSNSNNTTSSTSYAFIGSALGTESIANINENNATNIKTETTNSNANNNESSQDNNNRNEDSLYECNICLDTAKDAVVSMCGHLFCWPCLHQWLETRPNRKLCPVCKAAVDKDKVIPLYGRNTTRQDDPRNKVPPRPAGQRTEPEPQQGFQGFGFADGFHMSFGIGAFPFGFFASSFNFGEPRPAPANRGTTQYEDEQQLSKLFLYLAFLCIAWLLFA